MFNLERWNEILEAIRKNKFRTFLTGISVASGIFILVILLGVTNGMRNGITEAFAGDAINSFTVRGSSTSIAHEGFSENRSIKLTIEDYEAMRERLQPYIDKQSPVINKRGFPVSYKNQSSSYEVIGCYPDYLDIENCILQKGRDINFLDVQNQAKVAYVGAVIVNELFKDTSPIGELLLINGIPFTIVGTYTDKSGNWDENNIYIPFSLSKILGITDKINNMSFTLKPQKNVHEYTQVAEKVFNYARTPLKVKYKIAPEDDSAIRIDNVLSEAERIFSMLDMMSLFSWIIGICTILAGVVGVSNIMFIIVKERTKEIGIRKALGARPWAIIVMILHESIFMTTVFGLFGLLVGMGILEIIGPHIDSEFFKNPSVNFSTAIEAVFALVIAGSFAGFFPSYKASKIRPIIALKDD